MLRRKNDTLCAAADREQHGAVDDHDGQDGDQQRNDRVCRTPARVNDKIPMSAASSGRPIAAWECGPRLHRQVNPAGTRWSGLEDSGEGDSES